jgi:P27 family predicted phage terminase small subunit
LNEREPQPTGALEKPDFLSGEAAKEWDRLLSAMPPGLYTSADASVLAVYCIAWAIYRNTLAVVSREGMFGTGSMGQKVINPALLLQAKQAELLLKASDRLGLSPAARSRIALEDPSDGQGKFDGLFGGAPLRLVTP